MIKAIFFDWFNTLALYHPPRQELHSQALGEYGIELSPDELFPGLLIADKNIYEARIESKAEERTPEELIKLGISYEETMLAEVGIKVPKETIVKVVKRVEQLFRKMTFILFDDVLPVLKVLKEKSLILGLLTSLAKDMKPICRELGLEPYIDFAITPNEAGADKPKPPIFLAALQRSGVNASEAIHVGDQYKFDVAGARGVGITPILIDRYDLYPEVNDCPRIGSLTELAQYL